MNNNRITANKLFWGLLFLLGGVSLILNRLDIWPTIYNISLWDIILTFFFIWLFVNGISNRNFFEIIFALAFMVILYDDFIKIPRISTWTILSAAFLISVGLSIIFPEKPHFKNANTENGFTFTDSGKKEFNEADGEVIYFKNSFASTSKYINSDSLVNASLKNSFGEMKVYFDNAIIKNGIADINISVSFGELTLFIPRTWHVENHTKSTFGCLTNENFSQSQGSPVLRIYGEISFGEAKIVYI